MEDPRKRGRYGNGYGKQLGPREMNPYPPQDVYQRAHKRYEPKAARRHLRRRLIPAAERRQDELLRTLLAFHNVTRV